MYHREICQLQQQAICAPRCIYHELMLGNKARCRDIQIGKKAKNEFQIHTDLAKEKRIPFCTTKRKR